MAGRGWRECKLGDVLEFKRGYDLPHAEREAGPYPIISSSGITGHHNEAKVRGPGVVTGRYGTLGEAFYNEGDFWPLNTSLYVRDFKGNDPRFVSYLIKSLDLGAGNAAGAVPGLNRNHLHLLDTVLPPLPIQKRIAAILTAYDDLIEVNTRRIAILEEMARRIYEEWFVHGADPEWTPGVASDVIDFNPKTKVPKDGEKLFIPMGALSERSMIIGGDERKAGNSGAKFMNGDTLLARITPCLENGKTGFVACLPPQQPTACGSTEFIVMRSKSVSPEYVYCLARSDSFREIARVSMSGATGRQRVRTESLLDYPLAIPDPATVKRFAEVAGSMFAFVQTLAEANANLRAQRDLLLPRLVSGKLDVSGLDTAEKEHAHA